MTKRFEAERKAEVIVDAILDAWGDDISTARFDQAVQAVTEVLLIPTFTIAEINEAITAIRKDWLADMLADYSTNLSFAEYAELRQECVEEGSLEDVACEQIKEAKP